MSAQRFDVVITGSGFAGSIMGMIARRLGRSVLLLEKGSHPRFVIGESSTPLTNLLLERIANQYDLPRLLPLCKWGAWQKSYPEIGCGLKRGFNFFHHKPGERFIRTEAHENELMVGASPHDEIADTHWYRPDFDHLLVREAQGTGVDYREKVEVQEFIEEEDCIKLKGTSSGRPLHIRTPQLIDASGPNGFLARQLKPRTITQEFLLPTEGLYTHFVDVPRLDSLAEFASAGLLPYPQDDSAVHHLFEGGWIWVLRFNNGITSAGVSATREVAADLKFSEGEAAWKRLLGRYPSLQRAFEGARAILPFRHHAPLPFRFEQFTSKHWIMLPAAAGFVDPILSTGFPLALLGILRVAEMLARQETHHVPALEQYGLATIGDFEAVEILVGALYRNLHDPELFRWLSFLYFAPMLFSESQTRLGKRPVTAPFLMRDDPRFWQSARTVLAPVIEGKISRDEVRARITEIIEPYDLGGLLDQSRRNWHPADSTGLIRNAARAGVTAAEMQEMLKRCGA